jgi:hypothetical protein
MHDPSTHLYVISGCRWCYVLSSIVWRWGSAIFVITMTWSDSPFRVATSYSIGWVGSAAITRSTHDCLSPLAKVWMAGGPGWRPFNMCQPYISHKAISHGALVFTIGSRLTLGMSLSSNLGYKFPILVFQSPHIIDLEFCGMDPVMSSMRSCARSSSIPLFYMFSVGGR